ncbi:hypothetical protein QYF36_020979 [Acer negundo]|nr:hypothetical protein QYF36_020979 [Acer negundo]
MLIDPLEHVVFEESDNDNEDDDMISDCYTHIETSNAWTTWRDNMAREMNLWMLVIMDPHDFVVYFFDSLGSKPGVECGYYVMRYMKDIVANHQNVLIMEKFNRRDDYSQAEIDEVRTEWAEFVGKFCQTLFTFFIPVDVEWVEQFPGLVKFPTHLKDQLEYASIEEELLEVDKGRVRWDSNQDKAWCQAKRRSLEKNIHKKGNLSHGNEKFDFVRIGER